MAFVELLGHSSRYALGLVFLLAGAAKLADLAGFRKAVANYRLLPDALSRPVATALPFVEVLAAVLLGAGVATVAVALGVATLLGVFSTAVAVNLVRGRALDCGCFGAAAPRRLTWWTVARNLVLIGVAVIVVVASPGGLWLGPEAGQATGSTSPEGLVVAASLALMAVMGSLVVVEALQVHRRLRAFLSSPGAGSHGRGVA